MSKGIQVKHNDKWIPVQNMDADIFTAALLGAQATQLKFYSMSSLVTAYTNLSSKVSNYVFMAEFGEIYLDIRHPQLSAPVLYDYDPIKQHHRFEHLNKVLMNRIVDLKLPYIARFIRTPDRPCCMFQLICTDMIIDTELTQALLI